MMTQERNGEGQGEKECLAGEKEHQFPTPRARKTKLADSSRDDVVKIVFV
jgi:hypothetical protein